MPTPLSCGVCGAAKPKYKCPVDAVPYCSIACSTKHRESHAEPGAKEPTPSTPITVATPDTTASVEVTKTKLTVQTLGASPEFQNLLSRYPMLQQGLRAVYEASYAGNEGRQEHSLPGVTQVTSKAQERQDQRAIAIFKQMLDDKAHSTGLIAFAELIESLSQDEVA